MTNHFIIIDSPQNNEIYFWVYWKWGIVCTSVVQILEFSRSNEQRVFCIVN